MDPNHEGLLLIKNYDRFLSPLFCIEDIIQMGSAILQPSE